MLLTPMAVLALLLIGQSRFMGGELFSRCGEWLQFPTPTAGMFAIMAVSAVLFETTHALVVALYFYLVRDVIPSELLGRFYGVVRTVGAGAGCILREERAHPTIAADLTVNPAQNRPGGHWTKPVPA